MTAPSSPTCSSFRDGSAYDGEEFQYFLAHFQAAVPVRGSDRGRSRRAAAQGSAAGCTRRCPRLPGSRQIEWLCCEVNSVPPNPASLDFHRRLGFTRRGQWRYTRWPARHLPGEEALIRAIYKEPTMKKIKISALMAASRRSPSPPRTPAEVTVVSNVLGPEGPLYVDGNLYYVGWISSTLSKWDGKSSTVLNSDAALRPQRPGTHRAQDLAGRL